MRRSEAGALSTGAYGEFEMGSVTGIASPLTRQHTLSPGKSCHESDCLRMPHAASVKGMRYGLEGNQFDSMWLCFLAKNMA